MVLLVLSSADVSAAGTPVCDDGEDVRAKFSDVSLVFHATDSAGPGTLYVSTQLRVFHRQGRGCRAHYGLLCVCVLCCFRRVIWIGEDAAKRGSGIGYSLHFPDIGIHAISSDMPPLEAPCLYCQVCTPLSLSLSLSLSSYLPCAFARPPHRIVCAPAVGVRRRRRRRRQ